MVIVLKYKKKYNHLYKLNIINNCIVTFENNSKKNIIHKNECDFDDNEVFYATDEVPIIALFYHRVYFSSQLSVKLSSKATQKS